MEELSDLYWQKGGDSQQGQNMCKVQKAYVTVGASGSITLSLAEEEGECWRVVSDREHGWHVVGAQTNTSRIKTNADLG